jgi:hypothetical protein
MRGAAPLVCALLTATLLVPAAASAQGRGNGRPKPPQAGGPQTTVGSTSTPVNSGATAAGVPIVNPQFGSWLDDASTWAAGSGSTGIGIGYWRGSGVSQIDVPILNVSYGVTNRAQFGATVPFYRVSYLGTTERGLDDVYLNGKFGLVDPSDNGRFGLAVGTVLEILSYAPEDMSRVQWAVPVSMEVRGTSVRGYGSAGYFSRGAVFTAGAIEWASSAGTSVTGSLGHSVSVADTAFASGAESMTDISLFVGHPVARAVSIYGGAGQTFIGGTNSLALSGGVSFSFAK